MRSIVRLLLIVALLATRFATLGHAHASDETPVGHDATSHVHLNVHDHRHVHSHDHEHHRHGDDHRPTDGNAGLTSAPSTDDHDVDAISVETGWSIRSTIEPRGLVDVVSEFTAVVAGPAPIELPPPNPVAEPPPRIRLDGPPLYLRNLSLRI